MSTHSLDEIFPMSFLKTGESASLHDIAEASPLRQRLFDLGFTKGSVVTVLRKSLFGDPIQIKVRDSQFAIRKSDAKHIKVIKHK